MLGSCFAVVGWKHFVLTSRHIVSRADSASSCLTVLGSGGREVGTCPKEGPNFGS